MLETIERVGVAKFTGARRTNPCGILLKHFERITPRGGRVRVQTSTVIHLETNKLDENVDNQASAERWRVDCGFRRAGDAITLAFQNGVLDLTAIAVNMSLALGVCPRHLETAVDASRLADRQEILIDQSVLALVKREVSRTLDLAVVSKWRVLPDLGIRRILVDEEMPVLDLHFVHQTQPLKTSKLIFSSPIECRVLFPIYLRP